MPRQRHDNSNNWNSCISWFTDTMGSIFYHFTNERIKLTIAKRNDSKLIETLTILTICCFLLSALLSCSIISILSGTIVLEFVLKEKNVTE